MWEIKWSPLESKRLKRTRGVSFEEIIHAKFLGIEKHPNRGDQRIFVFEYKGYIWAVPFVFGEEGIFLKTIYPSRKFKKIYKERSRDEKNKIN
jgi:hypothetical protein